jgi:hypothetical protein
MRAGLKGNKVMKNKTEKFNSKMMEECMRKNEREKG